MPNPSGPDRDNTSDSGDRGAAGGPVESEADTGVEPAAGAGEKTTEGYRAARPARNNSRRYPSFSPVNGASPRRDSTPRKPRSSTRLTTPPPRPSSPDGRRAAANQAPESLRHN